MENKKLGEFFTGPFLTCTGSPVMLLLCLASPHNWLLQHLSYLGTGEVFQQSSVQEAAGDGVKP